MKPYSYILKKDNRSFDELVRLVTGREDFTLEQKEILNPRLFSGATFDSLVSMGFSEKEATVLYASIELGRRVCRFEHPVFD